MSNLDGVLIYHTDDVAIARKMLPVKPRAELPALDPDTGPLTPREQFWRNVRNRLQPHVVK